MGASVVTAIPRELTERPQWVVWRWEDRDGKATKPPYSAINGAKASSTDPSTWTTFEKASVVREKDGWDGIGFVFAKDDPFAGVDLDKCRNPDTGAIDPNAREIVDALDSYAEVSPSGTGLHVICRGTVPPGWRKKGPLEMYDNCRYFCVTGEHVEGTPLTIEERGEKLAALHARYPDKAKAKGTQPVGASKPSNLGDAELLEKAGTAKGGAKFTALMAGDWSGYASQSEGDSALCCKLAFWTGKDTSRIDRLFRQSGLYREKWDDRHHGDGSTYGQGTIQRALELTTEIYKPSPPSGNNAAPKDHADPDATPEDPEAPTRTAVVVKLETVAREEVDWIWQDRLPLRRLTGFIGDPGAGKSWGLLGITTAITKGVSLPGETIGSAPAKALILTAEDGLADTVVPRLEDMGADVSMVRVLDAVQDHDSRQMLSLVTDIDIIEDALSREDDYKLLILDPINAYLGSVLDTHRDAALRSVLAPLADLAERYSIAVAFILHLTKGQADRAIYRAQGNIAYVAAARVVHLVGVNPDDEDERIMACIKNNLVAKPPAVTFTLNEGQFRWKGLTDIAPASLLKGDDDEEVRTGALAEAGDFLRQVLADGPRGAEATIKEAIDVGIAKRTLMRAKAALKVSGKRFGELGVRGGGGWFWRLEPYDPGDPESWPEPDSIEDAKP